LYLSSELHPPLTFFNPFATSRPHQCFQTLVVPHGYTLLYAHRHKSFQTLTLFHTVPLRSTLTDTRYDPRQDDDFRMLVESVDDGSGDAHGSETASTVIPTSDTGLSHGGRDIAMNTDRKDKVEERASTSQEGMSDSGVAATDGRGGSTAIAEDKDDASTHSAEAPSGVAAGNSGTEDAGDADAAALQGAGVVGTDSRREVDDAEDMSTRVVSPRPPPSPPVQASSTNTDARKRSNARRASDHSRPAAAAKSHASAESPPPPPRMSPDARREAGWRGVEGDADDVKRLLERTPARPLPGNVHPKQPTNFDLEAPGLVGPLTLSRGRNPVPAPPPVGAPRSATTTRRRGSTRHESHQSPEPQKSGDAQLRELLAQRERELATLKQQYDAMVGRRPQKRATGTAGIHEHVAELRKTVDKAEVCACVRMCLSVCVCTTHMDSMVIHTDSHRFTLMQQTSKQKSSPIGLLEFACLSFLTNTYLHSFTRIHTDSHRFASTHSHTCIFATVRRDSWTLRQDSGSENSSVRHSMTCKNSRLPRKKSPRWSRASKSTAVC
jgi:hypothetical protein